MFKELAPIVASGTNLCIMVSAAPEGALMVTVLPQSKDQNTAMSTPLSVTATPDELDAELPAALTTYVGYRTSLAETLDTVKTIMEAAGKTASNAATKAANQTLTGSTDDQEGDEEGDLGGKEKKNPVPPARTTIGKAAAAPKNDTSDLNLWD